MGRKINVFIRSVDEDLWNSFKAVASNRRKSLWGVIGPELEKALKLYLEHYGKCARTQNDEPMPSVTMVDKGKRLPPRAKEKLMNLSRIAAKLCEIEGNRIHQQILEKIIVETVMCLDRRTVESYMNALLQIHRVIKVIDATFLPVYSGVKEKQEEIIPTVKEVTRKRRRPYLVFEVVKQNAEKLARLFKETV